MLEHVACFDMCVASFGHPFFEHQFYIGLGSIVDDFLDRPFGENLIFAEGLFAGRIRRFRICSDCSMISHRVEINVSIISGPFCYNSSIVFDIDVNRFVQRCSPVLVPSEWLLRLV